MRSARTPQARPSAAPPKQLISLRPPLSPAAASVPPEAQLSPWQPPPQTADGSRSWRAPGGVGVGGWEVGTSCTGCVGLYGW